VADIVTTGISFLRFGLPILWAVIPLSLLAQSGFVKSGGQAIPGATVAATQSGQSFSTVTDGDGHYTFPPLASGAWSVSVDMFGFQPFKKDVDYGTANGPVNFDLQLKESPTLQRLRQATSQPGGAGQRATATTASDQAFEQELQSSLNAQSAPAPTTGGENANESFLVSGSLSPGVAQGAQADSGPDVRAFGPGGFGVGQANGGAPGFGEQVNGGGGAPGFGGGGFGGRGGGGGGGFGGGRGGPGGQRGAANARRGQTAGAVFGNRRRRNQQIRGMASFTLQNSALNAKPFSLNGLDVPQAAYAQSRFSLFMGGPLVIPKIVKDPKTQFFLSYFGTRARSPKLFTETVPSLDARNGDLSQATQSLGTSATNVPISLFDPTTHLPFAGNVIPSSRLSPIALALLNYYPRPSLPGSANNYQYETAAPADSDNIGLRVQRSITTKDRLSTNFQYQRRDGATAQPFGYSDTTSGYGVSAQLGYMHNFSTTLINNAQVRFSRNENKTTPYFSLLPDVATQLGIGGTSSNPLDNGPPTLNFTNFGSLSDSAPTLSRNQSQSFTDSVSLLKGVHSLSFGAGYTRPDMSSRTDPNGRGTFNFTGVASSQTNNGQVVSGTGYDLADFLLGLPQSSSIQYSQSNNYFFQNQWNLYAQDEWKVRSNLTLILGVRYEYFSPISEKYGRLANLAIAPGFGSVSVITGSVINPDRNNFSPRLAFAYKIPWLKRSNVFRAGYGIYYNGQSYIQFGNLLAKQPPFAVSNNVNTSSGNILTLADGLLATNPQQVTNTFAVDRNYRTPYAGTWNASLQSDLGKGYFTEVGYTGTKGTRLDVRTLPNQAPPGSSLSQSQRNQLGNATGFTFDQAIGNSIFNALHVRLMRRFNRGISFNAFYQFAKSIDDSSTFGGAGNTVAQNWLDVAAERGLSSFDVRHQFQASFVWTSPVAGPGSHMAPDSKTALLLKDWQLSGSLTAQTGNPLTARVLGNTQQLAQTGGVGSGRAEATGQPLDSGSGFFNLNAFGTAPVGSYGNAGRNTIPGPGTFSLNVAFARSFSLAERRRLEFRLETTNLLNHVNYTNYYTVVNAVNYGLPSAAAGMRTMQAVVRIRF
jgi:trimeric autotransporter adhesin